MNNCSAFLVLGIAFPVSNVSLHLQQSRRQACSAPLVIDSTVRFISSLDGGSNDLDGVADGVLNVRELRVAGTGVLVIDVLRPTVTGPFAFPVQGWQGITSFQWNVTGSAQGAIDNLVIEAPASAR